MDGEAVGVALVGPAVGLFVGGSVGSRVGNLVGDFVRQTFESVAFSALAKSEQLNLV